MSLRKITTLLLLAAFALTQVPVQAVELDSSTVLPNVIVDAGTVANGANRDVVPITIDIENITGGSMFYQVFTGADNGNTFSVSNNGQLVVDTSSTTSATQRGLVITPPTGTEFVALNGYTSTVSVTINSNGSVGESTDLFVNTTNISSAGNQSPGGDSAILAKIISENGNSAEFGSTIPKGSIVAYFITYNGTATNTNPTLFSFENIGLSVPAGTSLSGNVDVTVANISGTVDQAISALADDTLTVATADADANGQIAVGLETESSTVTNNVLANLLSTAGTQVKIGPGYTTTTASNQSTLYVDTDALLLRAGEDTGSTTSTPTYYDTPFNTSSYTGAISNGNDTSVLNVALTNSTSFPNTSNARMNIVYSVTDLDGASTDASIVVDAVSVSIVDNGATSQKFGFLGSTYTLPTENGTALGANDAAVAVLYNGVSTSGFLRVQDFEPLSTIADLSGVDEDFGFDASIVPFGNKTAADAATTFVVENGAFATGVFPGVQLSNYTANDAQAVTTLNGRTSTATVGSDVADNGDNLFVRDEVTARLLPTGGNAVFVITGTQAADDLTDADSDLRVAPTNFATETSNNVGAVLGTDDDDTVVKNNVIMFARLTTNTVHILPMVNKFDGMRDVIKVRPEITLTLSTNSKANGCKVIATVSGNNIAGSQEVEVARVIAAGAVTVDATVTALPAAGTKNRLLAENGDGSFASTTLREAINLSSVSNTTSTDEFRDLITNGNVLDDTLPSFFCGGTVGDITNGPNAVPQQPYARAIVVEESAVGEFEDVVGLGTVRLRFTMPVGVDLLKTSTTAASNDVAVISTDGGGAGTFASSAAVTDYQSISEQLGGQAFIDVSVPSAVAGTTTVKNAIGLIFGAHSLVIPEGTTDFDVTVSLVVDDGASTTTGDSVLATLGTASVASGCSSQFTIAFCDDALANFGQASGPVESDIIANGSLLTSFSSAVPNAIRLLNTSGGASTTAFAVPDICITEAVPDAFPAGASATTPNIFGPGQTLSLAMSDPGDDTVNAVDVGFQTTGAIDIDEDSLSFASPSITGGPPGSLWNSVVTAGNNGDEFEQTTTVRISGMTVAKTASAFQPPVQNFTPFLNDGTDIIGSSLPAAFETRGTNGTGLSCLGAGGLEDEVINTFFNGNSIGDSTDVQDSDSFDFSNGQFLTQVFNNTTTPSLAAVKTLNDSTSSYSLLSDDTNVSVAVDDIEAVTNGLAAFTKLTVFTSTGELEPGSMINVLASSGDFVNVPVTEDGNFIAEIRGAEGDTIQLTQTPTSTLASADQVVILDAENQNLTPTLLTAVATDLGFGTITKKGKVAVVFTLTAVGRVDGETFVPTADQLTVGGNAVYAIDGTDDQFMSIVDFSKTDGQTVTATVDGTTTSVVISGLTSDFSTLGGRPILRRAREKTRKKDSTTRVIFKGRRLRNNGFGYIVKEDGTVESVTFRRRTRGDVQRNRVVSDGAASLPTDARYAVYHVPGRGITTIDLTN